MSDAAASRRGLLRGAAATLALGTAGCGFRPLYGEDGNIAAGDPSVAAELAATRVPVIPERFGQLLRRGLQDRLGNGREPAAPRWELLVGPSLAGESLGILESGDATRARFIATANWTLLRLTPRETVASGFERAVDAFNIQPNQFFAADTSREATLRRLADALAEEVVTRVAVRMRELRSGAAPRLIDPVPQPAPMSAPPVSGAVSPRPLDMPGGGLEGGIGGAGVIR
ncbi:LPS assembly lipoprotein LptE [Falsiroseomonas oryziterrae]|uniref:LPS assembly lipoprotein LptE n=1 Tax=Falsiroseomonas oryziterrae TaxID=2911368 RepID=UPI001F00A5C3|nr:LPS assembly lipoprotein LptE [Roseomonas sp. NPKOSM-4]